MKNYVKKIYNKFEYLIKYSFSAGISFLIDLSLFTIFTYFFRKMNIVYAIVYGTICARIISSFINYYFNKNKVFNHKSKNKVDKSSMIKFYILTIIQMLVSSFTVNYLFNVTKINETIIKIPVECVIFVVNFLIQRYYIFKNK